jgi:molybdopterin molybdotransferase/putative molybdopterin biosynthesis protein
MTRQGVITRVRELRERAGLSQSALAATVRVTRQSLYAIEAGRVTPGVDVALRLAQALGLRVEELFGEPPRSPISAEIAAPSPELGAENRAVVAEIGGRWVAHPLRAHEEHPSADGLVVRARRAVRVEPWRSEEELRDNVLLMGCARGLGVLADRLNAQRGAGRFVWLSRSSTEALEALAAGRVHLAGVHLVDARTGEANVPDVQRIVSTTAVALVTLARSQVGWVTARGNPKRIRSIEDVAQRGVRLAAREAGSGARRRLDAELRQAKLSPALARRAAVQAASHLDVARAVAFGAADTGLATLDAARALGLELVPIGEERYDLAVPVALLRQERMARFLDMLTSAAARHELTLLGYDMSPAGERVAELGICA